VDEQVRRFPKWTTFCVVGVVIGLALGLAVGWWFWPVQYTNTAPDVLRQDYRDDYITMVATAYEMEKDLQLARARLELLDPGVPTAPVTDLAERLVGAGGSAADIARLQRLAWALGALTPTSTPYLGEQP
jgi:hypothetical protein